MEKAKSQKRIEIQQHLLYEKGALLRDHGISTCDHKLFSGLS